MRLTDVSSWYFCSTSNMTSERSHPVAMKVCWLASGDVDFAGPGSVCKQIHIAIEAVAAKVDQCSNV